jgi:hypothetical protein
MLKVKVYPAPDVEPDEFEVDFVSLVSDESYGSPALVAPKDGRAPTARPGQSVLYINTNFVPFWVITRGEE